MIFFETRAHHVRGDLRLREDDHAVVFLLLQKSEQEIHLLVLRHGIKRVRHGLGGALAAADLDRDGVLQDPLGQRLERRGQGRGEEQRLPLFRRLPDDLRDIGQKAHVEHAIDFIEDQMLESRRP